MPSVRKRRPGRQPGEKNTLQAPPVGPHGKTAHRQTYWASLWCVRGIIVSGSCADVQKRLRVRAARGLPVVAQRCAVCTGRLGAPRTREGGARTQQGSHALSVRNRTHLCAWVRGDQHLGGVEVCNGQAQAVKAKLNVTGQIWEV